MTGRTVRVILEKCFLKQRREALKARRMLIVVLVVLGIGAVLVGMPMMQSDQSSIAEASGYFGVAIPHDAFNIQVSGDKKAHMTRGA